jgi:porphobilinogen synthase
MRGLVRETELSAGHLIAPLFIVTGAGRREPVEMMPGVERLSADLAAEAATRLDEAGVAGVILFGIPDAKDPRGSGAYDEEGVVPAAVRALKDAAPDLLVATDVCLCEYTSHGHCGVLTEAGEVDNDATLELLARTALAHARAGADLVAPSDMMDGRVGTIRSALDDEGFGSVAILSYAVKYASAFYGPFREAAGSAPEFGDRRGYQMDPPNADEAIREARLDLEEGADLLMVKPALPYLDVLRRVKDATGHPVFAYHVSGEYAMVKAAAARGWIDETAVMMESLTAIRRAGADGILTYFAEAAARRLRAG